MSRKDEREIAFKLIFALNSRENVTIDELMKEASDGQSLFVESVKNNDKNTKFDKNIQITNYIKASCFGVETHINEIDSIIKKHLKNWDFERISNVAKSILRLAIFELKFDKEDTSKKVIINEAINLAKKYGDEDEYKYINGVLGSVSREESGEKDARKED